MEKVKTVLKTLELTPASVPYVSETEQRVWAQLSLPCPTLTWPSMSSAPAMSVLSPLRWSRPSHGPVLRQRHKSHPCTRKSTR